MLQLSRLHYNVEKAFLIRIKVIVWVLKQETWRLIELCANVEDPESISCIHAWV